MLLWRFSKVSFIQQEEKWFNKNHPQGNKSAWKLKKLPFKKLSKDTHTHTHTHTHTYTDNGLYYSYSPFSPFFRSSWPSAARPHYSRWMVSTVKQKIEQANIFFETPSGQQVPKNFQTSLYVLISWTMVFDLRTQDVLWDRYWPTPP